MNKKCDEKSNKLSKWHDHDTILSGNLNNVSSIPKTFGFTPFCDIKTFYTGASIKVHFQSQSYIDLHYIIKDHDQPNCSGLRFPVRNNSLNVDAWEP